VADYLLDTNILSYWYNTTCDQHSRVVVRVNGARQPEPQTNYESRLFVSIVTLGEIEYGHRVAHAPDPVKQAAYIKFVGEQCPVVLEMTKHVAEHYGEMRAWLFNNCGPKKKKSKGMRAEELVDPSTGVELGIGENDLWIAAQAKTHNLVLVTHDSKGNFVKMLNQFAQSLTVEDWAL
jgi:predicted nucleic acid-binding protein